MIDSNKLSKSHWERNLRHYALHAEPLFNTFTSIDALRCVLFVRIIDAPSRELHWRYPESKAILPKYLSHGDIFIQACQAGELDIVKAMVERTQVELEARDRWRGHPAHFCGAVPVRAGG